MLHDTEVFGLLGMCQWVLGTYAATLAYFLHASLVPSVLAPPFNACFFYHWFDLHNVNLELVME